MEWYYATSGARKGPISEQELRDLADQQVVTGNTLVWREGMKDWQVYNEVLDSPGGTEECVVCGIFWPVSDSVTFGDDRVCCNCKESYVQRLKEGIPQKRMAPVQTNSETNGLAIAGFVCSILSFLTCFMTSLPGLILSILGYREATTHPNKGGKGLAVAGVIISLLPIILVIVYVVLIVVAIFAAQVKG